MSVPLALKWGAMLAVRGVPFDQLEPLDPAVAREYGIRTVADGGHTYRWITRATVRCACGASIGRSTSRGPDRAPGADAEQRWLRAFKDECPLSETMLERAMARRS